MLSITDAEWLTLYENVTYEFESYLERALGVKEEQRWPLRIEMIQHVFDICVTFYDDHDDMKYESWGDDI